MSVKTSSGRNANLGGLSTQPTQPAKSTKEKSAVGAPASASAKTSKTALTSHASSFTSPTSDMLSDIGKAALGALENIQQKLSVNPGSLLEGLPKLQNTNFSPLLSRGMAHNRPEILAAFDYISVAGSGTTDEQQTAVAFLKVQHAARSLLHDNIKMLLEFLGDDKGAASALEDIETAVKDSISDASARAKFLASGRSQLDAASLSLDPVQSQEKISSLVASAQAARNDDVRYGSLASLMSSRGYPESSLEKFAGTKVLATLLGDLNIMLTDDRTIDPAPRRLDTSAIDLVFTRSSAFQLSQLATRNPVSSTDDLAYMTSLLPADHVERIAVLVRALSRELRISSALANPNTVSAIKTQVGESPAPTELINSVIGVPASSIAVLPEDDRAALNSLYVRDDRGFTVLPFETRAIKSGTNLLVPGSEYYVESIVSGRVPFDTDPFDDVTSIILKKFTSVNSLIRQLMLYDAKSGLKASEIFEELISTASISCSGVNSSGSIIQRSALAIAVMRIAQDNPTIKSLALKLINMIVMARLDEDKKESSVPDATNFGGIKNSSSKHLGDIAADTAKIKARATRTLSTPASSTSSLGGRKISPTVVIDIDTLKTMVAQALEDEIVSSYTGLINATLSVRDVLTPASSFLFKTTGAQLFETVSITSSTISTALTSRGAIMCLLDSVADTIVGLVNAANTSANGYGFMTSDDTTRYSGLTTSDITYVVFEIFSSLASEFMSADFVKSALASEIKINVLTSKNRGFVESVEGSLPKTKTKKGLVAGKLTSATVSAALSSKPAGLFADDIDEIRNHVDIYDDTIIAILDHTIAIAQNAAASSETLAGFFNTKAGSANASTLRQITSKFAAPSVPLLFSRTQIALTVAGIDAINSSGASSPLENPTFDGHLVKDSALHLVRSLCAKKKLFGRSDDTVKILSVGLPAGMTKALPGAFNTNGSGALRLPKESDTIRIIVYRKNYEFEDVVYKPREFIFDVSRFVRQGKFNDTVDSSVTFDEAASALLQFIDVGSTGAIVSADGDEILASPDYSFLSDDEHEQMVTNHAVSFILGMYVRLLAGFDMSETSFRVGDDEVSVDDGKIVSASIILLQSLLGLSGTVASSATLEMLRASNPEIDDFITRLTEFAEANGVTLDTAEQAVETTTDLSAGLTSNVLAFAKVFGGTSFISGFSGLSGRLTTPKAFERVFHIPIDLDSFEVDDDSTSSTLHGKALVASQRFQQFKVTTSQDPSTARLSSKVRLDDLFVVIEPAYEA